MEIKEEFASTSICSQNESEDFNTNFVAEVKCEPIGYDIEAEPELKEEAAILDDYPPNETQDPLMLVNKDNKGHDMHTKVEVKEEESCSESISIEATFVYDEIKDGMDQDLSSSESSRSYARVSSDCTEDLGENLSFTMRKNTLKCKSQEPDVTETSSIEKSVYDKNIDSTTFCLKQDNLNQQNHTHVHDINTYTDNSVMVRHNLSPTSLRVYRCDICEKSFKWLSHLKQHNFMHVAKTTRCPICEKAFSQPSYLKRHILIHEGIKPYKCDICNKHFARISHLKQHNLIHESVKPYKCDICEKGFTLLSNLKRHNMVHEYGKQHKCNICGKCFTQSAYLKTHNLIHEGKQPHKCDICEKRFMHLSHLKSHNLIHEGKKPYKCGICEKSFIQLSHLKSHTFIHEGIKPFKCDICEKHFARSSGLKRHNLSHENKQA